MWKSQKMENEKYVLPFLCVLRIANAFLAKYNSLKILKNLTAQKMRNKYVENSKDGK